MVQDSFGNFHPPPPSQSFPVLKLDAGDFAMPPVGEQQPQVMGWYPHHPSPSRLDHPNYLGLHAPLAQVREDAYSNVDKVKEGDVHEVQGQSWQAHLNVVPFGQYPYPNWNNYLWQRGANNSNHPQQSFLVADNNVNPTTNQQSPHTLQEPAASNHEDRLCDSNPPTDHKLPEEPPVSLALNLEELCDGERVPGDQVPTKKEMEEFAKQFKQKRVNRGYTQNEVGNDLGYLYGKTFSQTTICRFESFQLSFKNMCQLRPVLERWVEDGEKNKNLLATVNREQAMVQLKKRKKRTNIDAVVKRILESYYMKNNKPNTQELSEMAIKLHMDKDVIRVWFCNRRQRDRRQVLIKDELGEVSEGQHMFHPQVGAYSLPQEMPPQAYMQLLSGAYLPAYNQ
ncbi:POU domain, class 5, transcription factor 1.1-like [Leptodactylus fuscus]|uniref:POU domain, class 5, transcription factor 1.1-like n=1 Tax=Leptodactylus fuscus TaxID=238119 RepID=UPI003F4F007B